MINEFLWTELEDMDVNDVYFQQNGTTCHKVTKPSVFCVKSFQGEWFLETAITIIEIKNGFCSLKPTHFLLIYSKICNVIKKL